MSLANLAPGGAPAAWRWLIERVWRLEHAFERSRAAARPEDDTRIRIFFVMAIFGLAFCLLALGATWAAVFSKVGGNGYLASTEGARGDLVDRNGQLLAVDLTHYALYIDPKEVWDAKATRIALTKALPEVPAKRIGEAVSASRRGFVVGGMTPAEKDAIFDLGLPGVQFEEQARRVYPLGSSAAHLIGFVDKGGRGLAGAERALDKPVRAAAAKGPDGATPLSVDLRVQAALEDEVRKAAIEFQAKGAVGLVTNVHTGEILGMTSYPDYDANLAGQAGDAARVNHAAASVYEMGSTFKAFTVAIGLDTGAATPASTFDAREPFKLGYRTIHDFHAARKILTLVEVFQHSSNIGTAMLAERIGGERLSRYFTALGLTRPAKVELLESARPLTPRKWDDDAVASTSFGHGINVSPLALAQAMGALLNGGTLQPMTILRMAPGVRPEGPRAVSEETSQQMLQIMRANVTGGSGKSANIPGLSVGGKTGTGEKYDPAIRAYNHQRQVSSFAAVFPTEGPIEADRYFVLVLLDEPKGNARTAGFSTGGFVAAPAAGKVIDRIAPFLGVRRQADIFTVAAQQPKAAPEAGL
ncbi:cell division protein FtsI/penicillin-binding protein 2 [Caulobacter sp. AP07]|uniref:peptidoglycan D,D-transpeptidase FtsI family protein n=1 Tax=Caulobacter sp. AP07 TaxID=1144304 RepID=UPI0002720CAA|nr:penicillin-binding protein 2 [Caulobacter sp. AP07]EJL21982.1 cell division protein FtsI/penicillin-binding protein 2 [Caulobacter sp. AP07]